MGEDIMSQMMGEFEKMGEKEVRTCESQSDYQIRHRSNVANNTTTCTTRFARRRTTRRSSTG